MILKFSTINVYGNILGIAIDTERKIYSFDFNAWKKDSIPLSPVHLDKIIKKVEKDKYFSISASVYQFVEESEENK